MKINYFIYSILTAVVLIAGVSFYLLNSNKNKYQFAPRHSYQKSGNPITTEAKDALLTALDDEYKAYATYSAVISKEGSIRPFSMIINAENQHIESLKALMSDYKIEIPENKYLGNISISGTVTELCTIGKEAEIANAKLYRERLIPQVSAFSDITEVFTNLMNASQNNHLRAFEKCSGN
jgi:hypothetical protein